MNSFRVFGLFIFCRIFMMVLVKLLNIIFIISNEMVWGILIEIIIINNKIFIVLIIVVVICF